MEISREALAIIEKALRHGNSVELKKEKGCLVVVEIERHCRKKETFIPSRSANRGWVD